MTETNLGILCTSLTPHNFSLQHKAVSSWREAGFGVLSVNCDEERSILTGEFTNVDFIRVGRDARKNHGKPLVYLDDVLAALTNTQASIVGIINADIILRAPELAKNLKSKIEGQCYLGNRTDLHEINETDGPRYRLGYDFFLFDPSFPGRIPPSKFCLGMPWWDYWLPLAALFSGVSIAYIDSDIAFHQLHLTNWQNDAFYQYGFQTRELLSENLNHPCRQQLEQFITNHFDKDIRKRQRALRALDLRQTDRAIVPPFAEALCAFIRHSARTVSLAH